MPTKSQHRRSRRGPLVRRRQNSASGSLSGSLPPAAALAVPTVALAVLLWEQQRERERKGLGFIDPFTGMLVAQGISAAVGGISRLISGNTVRNQQKEAATAYTRYAEELLNRNLREWKSLPAALKTRENQRRFLQVFDDIKLWFMSPEACGNPQMGKPGRACVEERVTPGARYTWYPSFHDPIAQDPEVHDAPVETSGFLAAGGGAGSGAAGVLNAQVGGVPLVPLVAGGVLLFALLAD